MTIFMRQNLRRPQATTTARATNYANGREQRHPAPLPTAPLVLAALRLAALLRCAAHGARARSPQGRGAAPRFGGFGRGTRLGPRRSGTSHTDPDENLRVRSEACVVLRTQRPRSLPAWHGVALAKPARGSRLAGQRRSVRWGRAGTRRVPCHPCRSCLPPATCKLWPMTYSLPFLFVLLFASFGAPFAGSSAGGASFRA